MRRVIEGKIYDTTTANRIVDVSSSGVSPSDFRWHETALYRTNKGAWFVAGRGNAMSRWAQSFENSMGPGCGIRPLTSDEVKELLERHEETELLEEYFSDELEEA